MSESVEPSNLTHRFLKAAPLSQEGITYTVPVLSARIGKAVVGKVLTLAGSKEIEEPSEEIRKQLFEFCVLLLKSNPEVNIYEYVLVFIVLLVAVSVHRGLTSPLVALCLLLCYSATQSSSKPQAAQIYVDEFSVIFQRAVADPFPDIKKVVASLCGTACHPPQPNRTSVDLALESHACRRPAVRC